MNKRLLLLGVILLLAVLLATVKGANTYSLWKILDTANPGDSASIQSDTLDATALDAVKAAALVSDYVLGSNSTTWLSDDTIYIGSEAYGMIRWDGDSLAFSNDSGSTWQFFGSGSGGGSGDLTEVQVGNGLIVTSGTGPVPVLYIDSTGYLTYFVKTAIDTTTQFLEYASLHFTVVNDTLYLGYNWANAADGQIPYYDVDGDSVYWADPPADVGYSEAELFAYVESTSAVITLADSANGGAIRATTSALADSAKSVTDGSIYWNDLDSGAAGANIGIRDVAHDSIHANSAGFLTSVGDADIAAGAVDGGSAGEIADGTVDSFDILDGGISDDDLRDTCVTNAKIKGSSIDSVKIINGGVGYEDIHAGAIGLTTHVTGTLPEANGGTGDTDLDDITGSAGVVVGNGANTIIGGNCTIAADTNWSGWKSWFGHAAWDSTLVKRIAISDSVIHSNVYDTAASVFFTDSIKVKNIVSNDSVKIVSEKVVINGGGVLTTHADSVEVFQDLKIKGDLHIWPGDDNEYALVSPYVTKSFLIADPESYSADTLMPIVIDKAGFPFGVEIDSVMLWADYDTSYSVVFVEQVAAGTYSVLSTLVNSGGGFYAIETPDTDAAVAAGSRIGIIIPSDDIDRLTVAIVFHRKAS